MLVILTLLLQRQYAKKLIHQNCVFVIWLISLLLHLAATKITRKKTNEKNKEGRITNLNRYARKKDGEYTNQALQIKDVIGNAARE